MLVTVNGLSIFVSDPASAVELARRLTRRGHAVVLGVAFSAALRPTTAP